MQARELSCLGAKSSKFDMQRLCTTELPGIVIVATSDVLFHLQEIGLQVHTMVIHAPWNSREAHRHPL